MKKSYAKRFLETILIAFAIIAFWYGVWGIMNLYLFPKNKLLGHLIAILIGVIVLYLTEKLNVDLI